MIFLMKFDIEYSLLLHIAHELSSFIMPDDSLQHSDLYSQRL